MSIKAAADIIRSQGRYGDTELMHVSPNEVKALQTLAQAHGKSLSTNPQTGLPEAFDLGAVLPAVAGTAVGSMMGMPWLGAAVGGLGTYATTGSLEKGLLAGLGAFGGASMGSKLASLGAEGGAGAAGALGTEAALSTGPVNQALSTTIGENISNLGSGLSQLASDPSGTWAQMGGLKGQGMNLGMMAAPALMGAYSSSPTIGEPEPQGDIRQFDWDPVGRRFVRRPTVAAKDYRGPQRSVFAYQEGGEVDANRSQLARFYREYLGREPDPDGLDYWANQISQGALTMADVQQTLQQSPEATRMRHTSDIEAFYRDRLGRPAEEAGMDFWRRSLESGAMTPQQVEQAIMGSPEAAGIAAATQQRQQAFSPMPQNRPDQMIGDMYYNALNRTPDEEGLAFWQNALASGQSPEQVRQMIMMSPEGAKMQELGSGRSAQQIGASTIPYRYETPRNIQSPGVAEYNQLLANRAAYEYGAMPMPDAMRPRPPEELQRIRDQQILGQQVRNQSVLQGGQAAQAAQSQDMQSQIDAAVAAAMASRGYNPYDMYSGGDGGFGMGDGGFGMGGGASDAGGFGSGAVAGGASGTGTDGEDGWRRGGAVKYAQGGIAALPKNAGVPAFQAGGNMENSAFVVPADVVSALGNGSTDAGVAVLNEYLGMAMPIEGAGDGLSDDIPATIDGEQPARVADGEVYIPPEVVAMIGGGDPERGAAQLHAMMDKIREQAHGSTEQQNEVRPEEVMPV